MPDLLDVIQKQLRDRLDELRPLVSEYQRLRDAEQALSSENPTTAAPGEGQAQRPPQRRGGRGAARSSSGRGQPLSPQQREANRQKVFELVEQRPGITKAELQAAAQLSGPGVAQTVRRMVEQGRVETVELPGGQTGYRLMPADDQAAGGDASLTGTKTRRRGGGDAQAGDASG